LEVPPENLKADPEEMEVYMDTFEESSEEMDGMRLEANPGGTEAAAVRQELCKKETSVCNIGSLEDRYGDRHLVVWRRRGAQKGIQDNVGSRQKSSATRKRMIHHTQYEREIS
jgi:methyl coenzyme M reductase subunit C-like uncharacterized protein (methanogenesis marker protein 7)